MSPLEIRLLLHIYASPVYIVDMDSPAAKGALIGFHQQGLTNRSDFEMLNGMPTHDHGISLTDRGEAHVYQLKNLPLPISAWLNAHGEVIKND